MKNKRFKIQLSVTVTFREKPNFEAEVRIKHSAGTTITIVDYADGWFLARDKQGMKGWFRAEHDPTFHMALKRAAHDHPVSLVHKGALAYLDHIVVGVWANRSEQLEVRQRLQTLLEHIAVLQDLAVNAQGYLAGDPNAEVRFISLMDSVLYQTGLTRQEEGLLVSAKPISLPGIPIPQFPGPPGDPCFFDSFAYGRIFEGLMRMAQILGDETNRSPEENYKGLIQRLSMPLAVVERLESLYKLARAVHPNDPDSIALFERWFVMMTAQPTSLGYPSTPQGPSPFPIPGRDNSFLPIDLCRFGRSEETARAMRCLCHEPYRVMRIVNLERSRVDGSPLVGEGCYGDLIEFEGSGFGRSREGGLGELRSEVIFSGPSRGVAVTAEDYVLWSDTRVQVRIPAGAGTGLITMRILCDDVDVSECGIQLRPPGGLLEMRNLTLLGEPLVELFTGGTARWCEDFAIRVRVIDAEEVTVRDEEGAEVFLPEGEAGPRRIIEGTITSTEVENKMYTLTARNACHEVTSTASVERRREFLLFHPGGAWQSGEDVMLTLRHYCRPARLGRSQAVFNLTFDDPDNVLIDPPDQIVVSGSITEVSITLNTRAGVCGHVLVTAVPEDESAYNHRTSSTNFNMFDTPRLTGLHTAGANACDSFRFEVTGDCVMLDPSLLSVHLREVGSGRSPRLATRILEVIPGSEQPSQGVVILCEAPTGLGTETYTVDIEQFGRTSNALSLTERPLRIPNTRIVEFTSSRSTINSSGSHQNVILSWNVRHASRIEIWASGGRVEGDWPSYRVREGIIHDETGPPDSCALWSGIFHDRIGSPVTYELRAYPFTGGEPVTRRVEIVESGSPAPTPMIRGIKLLRIWNCDGDRHRIHIYTRKLAPTLDVWREQGALDAGYDAMWGYCPRTDADMLELSFEDGAVYELQVVDPDALTCEGRNDPAQANCWRLSRRGGVGGPLILGDDDGYELDYVFPYDRL